MLTSTIPTTARAAAASSGTLVAMRSRENSSLDELKRECTQNGLVAGYKGATEDQLRSMLMMHETEGMRVPLACMAKASRDAAIAEEYRSLVDNTSVAELGAAFPEEEWAKYLETGWAKMSLNLSDEEKRAINVVHRAQLAQMGVVPSKYSTFQSSEGCVGYDSANGWHRNPSLTASHLYVATHPRMYRLWVGFYARLLLAKGYADNADTVLACIELAMQVCGHCDRPLIP